VGMNHGPVWSVLTPVSEGLCFCLYQSWPEWLYPMLSLGTLFVTGRGRPRHLWCGRPETPFKALRKSPCT
jgi:hypothetical protein